MTPLEISINSSLTQDRATSLMGQLAIRDKDSSLIDKLMELANRGFTDKMIIDNFHKNRYWIV